MAQLGLIELVKHIDKDRIIPAPNTMIFGIWAIDYYREIGLGRERKPSKLIRSAAKNLEKKGAIKLQDISRIVDGNSLFSPITTIESYGIQKTVDFEKWYEKLMLCAKNNRLRIPILSQEIIQHAQLFSREVEEFNMDMLEKFENFKNMHEEDVEEFMEEFMEEMKEESEEKEMSDMLFKKEAVEKIMKIADNKTFKELKKISESNAVIVDKLTSLELLITEKDKEICRLKLELQSMKEQNNSTTRELTKYKSSNEEKQLTINSLEKKIKEQDGQVRTIKNLIMGMASPEEIKEVMGKLAK